MQKPNLERSNVVVEELLLLPLPILCDCLYFPFWVSSKTSFSHFPQPHFLTFPNLFLQAPDLRILVSDEGPGHRGGPGTGKLC